MSLKDYCKQYIFVIGHLHAIFEQVVKTMTFSKTPLKGKSVSTLEFLTGHWKGEMGADIVEEYWLPEIHSNKAYTVYSVFHNA